MQLIKVSDQTLHILKNRVDTVLQLHFPYWWNKMGGPWGWQASLGRVAWLWGLTHFSTHAWASWVQLFRAEACPEFWAFSPPVGLPTPPQGLLRAMTWHLSGPLSSYRHWRRSRLLFLLHLTDPVLKINILFSNQWWVHQSRHHVSVKLTSRRGVSGFLDDLVSRLAEKGHPWISPGKGKEIRVYRRRQQAEVCLENLRPKDSPRGRWCWAFSWKRTDCWVENWRVQRIGLPFPTY